MTKQYRKIDYLTQQAKHCYAQSRCALSDEEYIELREEAQEYIDLAKQECERRGIIPLFL